jgi:hypothetical protein
VDDLTLINGVGPATASTLNDAGYETIEDVATADLEDLEEIVGAKADAFIASANELIAAEAPEEPTPEPESAPEPEPEPAPEPEAAESSFVGVWSSQVNLASSFELTILDADEDGSHAASLHYVICWVRPTSCAFEARPRGAIASSWSVSWKDSQCRDGPRPLSQASPGGTDPMSFSSGPLSGSATCRKKSSPSGR